MANTISLEKGANISLEKEAPGMKKASLNLVWDKRDTDGNDFDLDASLFMLTDEGKVRSSADFIFYNQPKSSCESVSYEGDNLEGGDEGELINIDLSLIPEEITRLLGVVTINKAEERKQSFGQIENAGARLSNQESTDVIATFDLSEDFSTETAMVMCELYKKNGAWKFKAVGQGFEGGLKALCDKYGVVLG